MSPDVRLRLGRVAGRYAVCRLDPAAPLPPAAGPGLWSATRTADELSVVCREDRVPPGARAEPGWACLAVAGPLPFALTGVLAALAAPLARAGVSLFALSTFDTDYLLVKEADLPRAAAALTAAGHEVQEGS
ncbi:MAG: ACT domain-containing protein [Deferrisomatales bacterium]